MHVPDLPDGLDPADWTALRRQGHKMLDDMLDHMRDLSEEPLWRAPAASPRAGRPSSLPTGPSPLEDVHADFMAEIRPYSSGNGHPGFMGWVQGGGSPVGMLAEMLAAGLNANLGGRDHMAIKVEQEVLSWTREMFGFPACSQGLFVTGASAANHIGVLVARTRALGPQVKGAGLRGARLTAYASQAAHGCIARAMQMAGLGTEALRLIPVDRHHRIDVRLLASAIGRDIEDGARPMMIVGNAGTVDVGATDDLDALADVALAHDLHFHVDGAFGALGVLSSTIRPRLKGLERADSLAFDWHKWGQAPYDAGFALVRNGDLMRLTFASDDAYLRRAPSGLAAGDWWPCDYGPDLSRGFKALKVWFMLKTYGSQALGRIVDRSCALARDLGEKVAASPSLELMAPVAMNIVVFGWRGPRGETLNPLIVEALHAEGRVAPSLTRIGGRTAIRAAFVNHRTGPADVDTLLEGVLRIGHGAQTAHLAA